MNKYELWRRDACKHPSYRVIAPVLSDHTLDLCKCVDCGFTGQRVPNFVRFVRAGSE